MKPVFRNMCSYSETMPNIPELYIPRDQYLDLFDEQFKENRVLCVTGAKGVGVSTVLAFYVSRHSNTCVSYFNQGIYASTIRTRDFERSIVRQLMCYIDNSKEYDDEEPLSTCLYKVNRKLRNTNDFLYFVFDGLDSLSTAYADSVQHLFSQLYTIENARFLFSGKVCDIRKIIIADTIIQTNNILPFADTDVRSLLVKLNPRLSDEQYGIVYQLCHKGKADRLSIIVDKLTCEDGMSELEYLYENCMDDLFSIEWDSISKTDTSVLCFALLTYSEYPLTLDSLRKCLSISNQEMLDILSCVQRYILIKENIVAITSDVFRKYLADKLSGWKNEVELMLISLLENEDVSASFEYLPTLYKNRNKQSALVDYLTSEKVQHYLESNKSQAALNQQCEYGYRACDDFESQVPFYFRFAVNRSVSREIERNDLVDAEIEALIAIGEFEKALALTQNVFLLEEKLKCLLIIARSKDKFSDEIQHELEMQIESLIRMIQFEQIPDKAIELAKLMLPVNFAEALSIIDRIAIVSKDRYQLDRLYAAISISYNQEGKNSISSPEKEDLAEVRIVDDELRQMATAMKSILVESSVEQVICEMEKLPTVTSKLYFLQFWIPNHKTVENIDLMILYALRLVIEASNTTVPKLSLVRRYCEPLLEIDVNKIKSIVEQIDALTYSIKYPTIEYVELQLLVAKSLSLIDESLTKERIQNLYLEVLDISDRSIQVHCKSLFLRDFDKIGAKRMEEWLKASFELQKEIADDIVDLLSKSAYHIKVVEGPIRVLVCSYPTLVQSIISKINTEQRRCRANLIALSEYINQIEISTFDWKYFKKLFDGIVFDRSDLEKPIRVLSQKVLECGNKAEIIKNIKILCEYLCVIEHAEMKCAILSSFYVWACNNDAIEELRCVQIKDKLDNTWNNIGLPWLKVEVGYQIAKRLSKISMKKDAHEYVEKTTKLRDSQLLASFSCASAYTESLQLFEHSLGILIRTKLCNSKDVEDLKMLLSYDDAQGEALIAWARIALEYNNAGDHTKFAEIVHKYLTIPYKDSSLYYQKRVLYHLSPALYLCGPSLFYDRIKDYDVHFKNLCIENVSQFIKSKYPYSDYLEDNSVAYQQILIYEDFEKLLDLMEHSCDECFIYDSVDFVSKELAENRDRRISIEQKLIIRNRLFEIVSRQLPMLGGIQHDGYKILCNTIINAKLVEKNIDVVTLQNDIEKIDNIADQAFLYSYILGYLKKSEQRELFLDLAIKKSDEIENMFDKLNRVNICLLQTFDFVPSKSSNIAKKIMASMNANNNGSYQEYQRFIDVINEHDSSLAEEMLENLDNDPSRVEYRKKLKKRITSTQRINSARNDLKQISALSSDEQIRFFNEQMDCLVKRKGVIRDISTTETIIDKIFENPISEVQTAIVFFMENLYEKNCLNKRYDGVIREMHHVLHQNLKLVLAIAAGTQDKLARINRILSQDAVGDNIVMVGEGHAGFDMLINWYRNMPLSDLRIIDPYFCPNDMYIIKSLMDINNSLRVVILTHKGKMSSLDAYQIAWNKISSGNPGSIEIKTVCFEEALDKCPIHDRWWVLYDNENDKLNGKRLASLSTFGSRETEISDIKEEDIAAIDKVWIRYVVNGIRRIDGRALLYDNIIIK